MVVFIHKHNKLVRMWGKIEMPLNSLSHFQNDVVFNLVQTECWRDVT